MTGARPFQYTAFLSYSHAADGRLAEVLQSRLQTFAKPWYRRRSIRLFRDTTGLGLTPDLWESIRTALEASQYFLLFASEQAARSRWVEQEVDAWLRAGSADRLLIVWTDGELDWDRAAGDFDWARTTCLPPRLRGVWRAEPLHLDLRWARSSHDLSPRRPEFLEAVARLSATLRQQPVDDLIGEDIRQHRRTRRLAGAAVVTLSALLVGAVIAAGLAVQQRNLARQQGRLAEEQRQAADGQRVEAERQRLEAERQRVEAERQREAAEAQRREAERQQRVAEEQREESRQRLVHVMVTNGLRRIDERDLSGSALWFAEALRLEVDRPRGQGLQRVRLRSALRQHPGLLQVWSTKSRVLRRWLAFSRDGRYAITDALEGDIVWPAGGSPTTVTTPGEGPRMWDPETGLPLPLKGPPSGHRLLAVDPTTEAIRLVTSGPDGMARLWDGRSGADLARMAHPAEVRGAEFSPDGRVLVTASEDRVARLWDTLNSDLLASFPHDSALVAAAPTRDRRRVLSITQDNTGHIWTLNAGAQTRRHVPLAHKEPVQSIDVSTDGRRALTLDGTWTARLWDIAGGEQASVLESWIEVNHAELSSDGKLLLMATRFGDASVWGVEQPREMVSVKHTGVVLHASFSLDGGRFATASTDRTARVWDVRSGAPLTAPLHHEDTVSHVAFSPDRARLATATASGIVRVWGPSTTPVTYAHKNVERAVFHPDGRRLLTVSNSAVQLWDLAARTPLALGVAGQVHHASFSPDGRRIVTGSRDGTARIWDAGTGAEILSLRHGRYVTQASFRPDGRWLATAGRAATGEYEVALWDLRSGAKLFNLPHDAPVIYTEFAPDGRTLLTAAFSRLIRVWDLGRRQEIVAMRRPDSTRATFSPDGTRLAVVEKGTSVVIYDAGHGRPLVSGLRNDNYAINDLAFAPDGRSLLIVSEGSARIYDARTGVPLTPPLMHQATSGITHAAFSRDGRRVVTVATDSSARVWDTDTGQALTPPIEHRAGVRHGAFSHDGLRMAATGGDAVHLWDLAGPASPASDAQLALQAQVLAARRIDATGAVVPLGAVEFRDAWAKFRAEARATR